MNKNLNLGNCLDALMEDLLLNLFSDSGPFARRLVVIPHLSHKMYLMQKLANDPRYEIAAGIQLVGLSKALEILSGAQLPSQLELTLFIEYHLRKAPLKNYFDVPSRELRFPALASELSILFLKYGTYGGELEEWQKPFWELAASHFTFPNQILPKKSAEVHLFGFGYIPEIYLDFFTRAKAKFYLLSPCRIYWGDYLSPKEEREAFKEIVDAQNPLLASWGWLGKKMVQEPDQDLYQMKEDDSLLHRVQNDLLDGEKNHHDVDESIQWVAAPTKLAELHLLKNKLLYWMAEEEILPSEILVLAPDMERYAPYLGAVFSEDDPFEIVVEDLPRASAFGSLLALVEKKFERTAVIQFLSHPSVREKVDLNLLDESLQQGFEKLLYDVAESVDVQIDLELLDGCYRIISSLKEVDVKEKLSIPEWLERAMEWLRTFFVTEESDPLLSSLKELYLKFEAYDEPLFPFVSFLEWIDKLLAKKQPTSSNALQAVRFRSLSSGVALPYKVIYLLGMQEDAFPRRDNGAFSCVAAPTRMDEDRQLFLELFTVAKQIFVMSFPLEIPGEDRKAELSSVCLELLNYVGGKIQEHAAPSLALQASSQSIFNAVLSPKIPRTVDLKKLSKLAKHPLKFYLQDALGLYVKEETSAENEEFLLSPLKRHMLKKEALKLSLDDLLEKIDLPHRTFSNFAKQKIVEVAEEQINALEKLEITPDQIFKVHLSTLCIEAHQLKSGNWIVPSLKYAIEIIGELEEISHEGFLVRGKDLVAIWPRYLIYLLLPFKKRERLLFLEKGEALDLPISDPEAALNRFLNYYQLALTRPALPWTDLLLSGDFAALEKELKAETRDEQLKWLMRREKLHAAHSLTHFWTPILRETFGKLHEYI